MHCTGRLQRAARKSKHRIGDACSVVCSILELNPQYGVVTPGHPTLRKMRVKAPGLTVGKSGGYRLIYSTAIVDECQHFVLLEIFYKGDREDLDPSDYTKLKTEAALILGNVIDYPWQTCGDS